MSIYNLIPKKSEKITSPEEAAKLVELFSGSEPKHWLKVTTDNIIDGDLSIEHIILNDNSCEKVEVPKKYHYTFLDVKQLAYVSYWPEENKIIFSKLYNPAFEKDEKFYVKTEAPNIDSMESIFDAADLIPSIIKSRCAKELFDIVGIKTGNIAIFDYYNNIMTHVYRLMPKDKFEKAFEEFKKNYENEKYAQIYKTMMLG